jgi:hypothetical protein
MSFKEWLYGLKQGNSPTKLMSRVVRPASPFSPSHKKDLNKHKRLA